MHAHVAGRLIRQNCRFSQPRGGLAYSVSNVALTLTLWLQARQQKQRYTPAPCTQCLSHVLQHCRRHSTMSGIANLLELLRLIPLAFRSTTACPLVLIACSASFTLKANCSCSCGWSASLRHGSTAASSLAAASGHAIWPTHLSILSSTCCKKMLHCVSHLTS